jgi:hypothetical protein
MPDTAHLPVRAEGVSPGYWRVTFDKHPVQPLRPRGGGRARGNRRPARSGPDVKVVVFGSALPGFFMAHPATGSAEAT